MAYVVTQPCCSDASCVPACPVDCIHPTPEERAYSGSAMLYIDPKTCIDCGACADVCPVDAIVPLEDMEPGMEVYGDLNAAYYEDHPDAEVSSAGIARAEAVCERGPLRVAIIGSGPAACYAAEQLSARNDIRTEISMFERLPVPFGLVRFGVAPDHAKTKGVTGGFQRTLSRNVNLYLNVEVGQHISHEELMKFHHAVVYATGASDSRNLDIPGEHLPGSHAARDFVMWYNGHPDFAHMKFDLSCEQAVVVGNGNVALDVARVLASDPSRLRGTDIADHALEALSASKIRNVVVLGRRGPDGAAFSTPELINLGSIPGVNVVVSPEDLETERKVEESALARIRRDVLAGYASNSLSTKDRNIVLRFLSSPVSINGEDHVRSVRIERNRPADDDQRLGIVPTGDTEDIECGLVLRSIGFRGTSFGDLPFDAARGTFLNNAGRVIDPHTGDALSGVYTAGWIKRGPVGVIGSNKACSQETIDALISDYAAGALPEPAESSDGLLSLIGDRQPGRLDLKSWKAIDAHERRAGREVKRPRVKLTDLGQLLDVGSSVST